VASLIDTLIETLTNENGEYKKLLRLSASKTEAIVKGDLESLRQITDNEQELVTLITSLETRRTKTMEEIAKILNTDVASLKLGELISLLKKTPREQKELAKIHDELKVTLHEMKIANERNEELLNSAIEMVDFNMNLIQAMRKAPETANYNKGAYSTGSAIGVGSGGFDARQ